MTFPIWVYDKKAKRYEAIPWHTMKDLETIHPPLDRAKGYHWTEIMWPEKYGTKQGAAFYRKYKFYFKDSDGYVIFVGKRGAWRRRLASKLIDIIAGLEEYLP